MNLTEIVTLQVTGTGSTPEAASQAFSQALNAAMQNIPGVASKELVGRPYFSPILSVLEVNGGMGGYQRHANAVFVREAGDPADGWDVANVNGTITINGVSL